MTYTNVMLSVIFCMSVPFCQVFQESSLTVTCFLNQGLILDIFQNNFNTSQQMLLAEYYHFP